jgi:molecular chaperone DnaK (HSP70)
VSYSLGIDLGSTFVAAARATAATVEAVPLGNRSLVTPAAVYLQGDGTLATGDAASRGAVSSPDRVGRDFTCRVGDPTPVVLGGESYSVTALLGVLLRDVVAQVTETEGAPPDRVVLTHPTNWGPFRRALFEEATQQAGLTNSLLMTEAEAAAAHYTSTRPLSDGETMAVYDLGGGTFDATVLRMHSDGVKIIGKPERIEALGGGDFDEAILSHVNDTADGALAKLDVRRPQTFVALARVRQETPRRLSRYSCPAELLTCTSPGRTSRTWSEPRSSRPFAHCPEPCSRLRSSRQLSARCFSWADRPAFP